MGNRAVITTNENLKELGIYVHWNGGRDSVEGFLAYCKMKGYRCPEDDNYGWAYLAGVITNFFGDGYSCGIDVAENLDCDNYDNGVYIIKNWLICGRKFNSGIDSINYDLREFLTDVDSQQPKHMRLTAEEWRKFNEVEREIMEARVKWEI